MGNISKLGVISSGTRIRGRNNRPVVDAGINQTIILPTNTATLSGSAYDIESLTLTYLWKFVSGPATYTMSDATNPTTNVLTNLVEGTYTFALTAKDGAGAIGSDNVIITVALPPNISPIADITSPNQTITLPTNTVNLTGVGTDSDGTIVSYLWTKVSGPTCTINTPTNQNTTISNMVAGTYVFQLAVTDNRGGVGTHQTTILVNPVPNQAPIANAGGNKNITLPTNTVTLVGSGTDTDGTIASYLWTQVSGPNTATIVSSTSPTTIVNNLIVGTYVFQLRVTDNSGATATNNATVVVNPVPNILPVVSAGNNQTITLPTQSTTLIGSATDADGTISSFLWTKISGPNTFNIVSPTATVTTVNGLSTAGTYIFQLQATDNSGGSSTSSVTITVNAAPPPNQLPIANAGVDKSITLPTNSVTVNGSGTDTDGTVVSYLWTKISGPSTFNIVNSTSATTAINNLVVGTYIFQLQVTDNLGGVGTDTVTIIVNPANVAPIANAGVDKIITLPTSSVTLTGNGTDTDGTITAYLWSKISGPSTFNIVSANLATTIINNLTIAGTYVFRLTVTDNSGATATDDVTITVNPVPNIAPTANAGVDQVITLPTASVTLTGSGTDTDGTIVSYAWTKVSGPATFTIVSPTAATTVVNNLVAGTYVFRLTVTDNGGLTGTDTVQVTVNPAPNVLPIANAGIDQTITLPTNSVSVSGAGSTDADGTIVSYLWNKFSGSGGVVTSPTSASTTITGLIEGSYVFQLTVTDNAGGQATDMINITVLPVTPSPPTAQIALASAPTTPITGTTITLPTSSISLVDASTSPGYAIVSWSWTKLSGAAGSVITTPTASATTITGLTQGTHVFQLQVWIGAPYNLSGTTTITITVNPVVTGRTFYVSTTGSDTNSFVQAQNIATPWKTLGKAMSFTSNYIGGDTIYVRGGTYASTAGNGASVHFPINNLNGSSGNMIKIHAYPGEVPIFNCSNITPTPGVADNPMIMQVNNCSWLHLKGFKITMLKQVATGVGLSFGFQCIDSTDCIFEQLEAYNLAGTAFITSSYSKTTQRITYLNCDGHHTGEGLDTGYGAWNSGDGFSISGTDVSTDITYDGCRAWLNCDDGFDFFDWCGQKLTIKNCWSFWNGVLPWKGALNPDPNNMTPGAYSSADPASSPWLTGGCGGEGFKFGGHNGANPNCQGCSTCLRKYVNNCVSFENTGCGFTANGDAPYSHKHQILNCIAYKNGNDGWGYGTGRSIGIAHIFKNNISWNNNNCTSGGDIVYDGVTGSNISNNYWGTWYNGGAGHSNPGNLNAAYGGTITVTNTDFVSVTSTGADGPRQADGSLPNLNYLKLASTSDLINKGINVSLPYNGATPDLGPYEY